MSATGQKRPWLAALLSVVYPGLGHLYLRSWIRSLMWFGLVMSALVVLVPATALEPAETVPATASQLVSAFAGLSLRTQGLLVGIVAMEAFDAYMLALRSQGTTVDADECPHCGKELDEDLDFCHWCTTDLER